MSTLFATLFASSTRTRANGGLRTVLAAVGLAGTLAAFACNEPHVEARRAPDLVLITVDTLRADHLGSYGYPRDTSPNLDALAARGVRFHDASVQWPSTWPSMASMLTGTYPAQTGVRHTPYVSLAPGNVTLAERLRDAGYQTAAIVSNANLGTGMAFDQGFEDFVESWMEEFRKREGSKEYVNRPGLVKRYTDAALVTDQALAWLARRDPTRPFFLWVHYMDPHGPYVAPPEVADLFEPESYPKRIVPIDNIPRYQRLFTDEQRFILDLGVYERRYDQLIRYFDTQLPRLLGALDALPEPQVIALTADHGESLSEHGYYLEHGLGPFQQTARVPLLLVHEGDARLPAGRVVESPVGLVQLVPTLLELLRLPAPETLPARSLMPRIAARSAGTGGHGAAEVFLQAGQSIVPQRIVRRGPWKLVHMPDPKERAYFSQPKFALYHLGRDPGELRNVAAEHPQLASELRNRLDAFERSLTRSQEGLAPVLSEDERRRLEQLGYIVE